MAGKVKLTEAQRRMLETVPDEMTRWTRQVGMPFLILNKTADVLKKLGLIETAFVPPRWKRTAAGRAFLTGAPKP